MHSSEATRLPAQGARSRIERGRAAGGGAALLITALVLLIYVVVDFSVVDARYRGLNEQSDRAHAMVDATQNALSALKDAETGQRGFLITLDPAYLRPYGNAITAWADNIASLKSLASDSPDALGLVEQLARAGSAKFTEMAATVDHARNGQRAAALARVETGYGKRVMDEARRISGEIISREESEFSRLQQQVRRTETTARWRIEAVTALLFLLTFAGTILLNKEIARERLLTRDLEQSERKYRDLAESLEDQVEERTRELRILNEELQSFSYSVSHDLRAPLRAIDGFSQMLVEDYQEKLDAPGRELLQRVRRGAKRMGHLIQSLLDLSRAGRVELQMQDVSISDIAESVVQDLRQAAPDREVRISIQPGLTAKGDPHLITIVLENLLSNAWKFTSRTAQPQIEVGAAYSETGEREFFIGDNGPGFDPAYAARLFKPFQRLHSESEFEGTGIGLATAQRVVRRHGGTMRAESNIGKGATFYFTL